MKERPITQRMQRYALLGIVLAAVDLVIFTWLLIVGRNTLCFIILPSLLICTISATWSWSNYRQTEHRVRTQKLAEEVLMSNIATPVMISPAIMLPPNYQVTQGPVGVPGPTGPQGPTGAAGAHSHGIGGVGSYGMVTSAAEMKRLQASLEQARDKQEKRSNDKKQRPLETCPTCGRFNVNCECS